MEKAAKSIATEIQLDNADKNDKKNKKTSNVSFKLF